VPPPSTSPGSKTRSLDQAMNQPAGATRPPRPRTKAYQSVSRRFAVDLPFHLAHQGGLGLGEQPQRGGLLTRTVPTDVAGLPVHLGVFFPKRCTTRSG